MKNKLKISKETSFSFSIVFLVKRLNKRSGNGKQLRIIKKSDSFKKKNVSRSRSRNKKKEISIIKRFKQ